MAVCCITACTAKEDTYLREKYIEKAGTPVSKKVLQNAISVTQPFPNKEGQVKEISTLLLKTTDPISVVPGTWAGVVVRKRSEQTMIPSCMNRMELFRYTIPVYRPIHGCLQIL